MKKLLIHLLKDWGRAPISGTAILVGQTVAGILLWRNEVDRALLVLIMCQLWMIQRGPFNG